MNTGNQDISFEIKSQLAKLLATENIIVEHKANVKTAMFDVKDRILTLPVWQNISPDLYDMLVVHEVGHALDTPLDGWESSIDTLVSKHHPDNVTTKTKRSIHAFLNVVEDARIDKRQKRRYPGSRRNYTIGYKELLERNFFGTQNHDINTLPLIDRINIYFKSGHFINIKFTPEEKIFLEKISGAETFPDVVSIVDELYAYCVQKKQEENEQKSNQSDDADEQNEDDNFDFNGETDDDAQEAEENETDEELDDDTWNDDTDESDDADDSDDTDEKGSAESSDSEEVETDDVPTSVTEEAARKNLDSIVRQDDVNYIYLKVPTFDTSKLVDDYKVVIPSFEKDLANPNRYFSYEHTKESLLQELSEWKRKERDTISFMVKEFEMKKAADMHSRISVAKTGVIDTNKLHSYKYNEDIFRRLSVLPNGKNHGFVMFLDWSGSMTSHLRSTLKQLFSLTMFCRQVQIPFEVYLFRTAQNTERTSWDERQAYYRSLAEGTLLFDEFRLRNVLSSRMDLATFNKAQQLLWLCSVYQPYHDQLDSTPLNQAILVADQIVNQFRIKNKLQVVNTVFLTDGGSDPTNGWAQDDKAHKNPYKKNVLILNDHITKKTYFMGNRLYLHGHEVTTVFLKILKERTNSNVLGFFLHGGNIKQLSYLLGDELINNDAFKKQYREEKYVALPSLGYDEYYIINCRDLNIQHTDLQVDSSMTKARIAKEFIKYSDKKTTNRVLLSRFIARIAKESQICNKKVA